MQGYSTPSLLYDEGFFGRSELNFNDHGGEPTISSGLLGLSDSLDRLDTASSFGSHLEEMDCTVQANVSSNGGSVGPHVHGIDQNSHLLSAHHGSDNNSFSLDVDNGSLLMQDMLHGHHHQHISDNGSMEASAHGGERTQDSNHLQANGVTTQWEESLQDLQSLLALHGQHGPQMQPPEASSGSFNSSSSALLRGYGLDKVSGSSPQPGFSNSCKFPGDSELMSLLQYPRSNSSVPSLQPTHAGPVSAFPSNPGFRKGVGGPVNACNVIPSLYSASSVGNQNASSSFPYTAPGCLPSNYFNLSNPGSMCGNSGGSHLLHAKVGPQQSNSSSMLRAPSIIDLSEQARDHSCEDSVLGGGKSFSSSLLFESTKRGSSEGSLLSGKCGSEPRGINHFATERQRREYLNEKYQTLRALVPNPSKADRASIVADAIEYVKELKRTVQELQILVQEKRREKSLKEVVSQGAKRRRMSGDGMLDLGGNPEAADSCDSLGRSLSKGQQMSDPLSADGSHLRSSWLQRTSQSGTHVDVRIVHDEVTIKLTQRRRKGFHLQVMVTLFELHLDLQHASGGTIGEHDVYIFNTKILEGSSTFAGYVATKLIEAIDCI